MLPIASLDALSRDEFALAIRPLFEMATPLANAIYERRPFSSYAVLVDTAESLAKDMTFEEQVAVLAAHPRIGAKPASLSATSAREQGVAPEPQWVYEQLSELNASYEQRFGFRFVVFVNRRSRREILDVLRQRINNTREAELAIGLRDMFQIARDRMRSNEMHGDNNDPARVALLHELKRRAVETYGEDRAAETTLKTALETAATALWRVTQEPFDPAAYEPFPTHD